MTTKQWVGGRDVLVLAGDGGVIDSPQAAADVIGEAFSAGLRTVVIPVERLDPSFFRLASGLAGEVLQKFVNYGFTVAIVGDIDSRVAGSKPLADFVRESNKGTQVWFVPDAAALAARLASGR
ncbi:MAG: alpha/beta hydrolase [Caulobacteraceae bacterium]|nr:alpha/beta hydrolase [Caulobacteraceae bacterium]